MGHSQVVVVDDCKVSLNIYHNVLDPFYHPHYFFSWEDFVGSAGATAYPPALLIAELGDPGRDCFFSLMKSDYRRLIENRVLIITACEDPALIRGSLDLGAVDCMVKPFNQWELLVKVDRFLRRNQSSFPLLQWDPVFHQVHVGEITITLTSKEYQILSALNKAGGAPLTRESIMKQTWGDITVATKSLDVHLFNLRRKIEPLGLEVMFLRPNYYKLAMSTQPDPHDFGLGNLNLD
jgi:DNA-binding response OmpR family regulator